MGPEYEYEYEYAQAAHIWSGVHPPWWVGKRLQIANAATVMGESKMRSVTSKYKMNTHAPQLKHKHEVLTWHANPQICLSRAFFHKGCMSIKYRYRFKPIP